MLINTPISLGELVDKISILIIKQKNITDETKLDHVKKELDFLQKTLMNYVQQEEINNHLENLININSKLWNIEDDIRECERKKMFDAFKETLNKYNKPYILVSGSKSNRLETAIKEINKLLDI